jgi:hypothetical protein
MNKKILFVSILIGAVTLSGIGVSAAALATINSRNRWHKVRVADPSLYSGKGYVDYAKEVFFDTDRYPDLAEEGLFWTKWNGETGKVDLTPADSAEGAALVDTSRPTIILVHGMLADGYYSQEQFYLNSDIARPEEFNLETDDVPLAYLWMRAGWNVGYFQYNRFAAESMFYYLIEGKIWSTEGGVGMRYRRTDNTTVDNCSPYVLAEHFAAEYIRAMNYLPDTMGDMEIRIAAHSMGGMLSAAGMFLLTELADAGQLDPKKLPDRYAMLDPFFGVNLDDNGEGYMGMTGLVTRWSGKPLYRDNTGFAMLECLKDIVANGTAVEYYTSDDSFLRAALSPGMTAILKTLVAYEVVYPDYSGYSDKYTITMNGHNGIRDWYLCSIFSPPVLDVTSGYDPYKYALSASTPTDAVGKLAGASFHIEEGAQTVNAGDDKFIKG